MLISTHTLRALVPAARDGAIGKVRELCFDDARWIVRHLVIDTGGWLTRRHVRVAPQVVERVDLLRRRLVLAASRRQIEAGPGIDAARPSSGLQAPSIDDRFGFPHYRGGADRSGLQACPAIGDPLRPLGPGRGPIGALPAGAATAGTIGAGAATGGAWTDGVSRGEADGRVPSTVTAATVNPRLHGTSALAGYPIAARDGDIGRVADFLFDDRSWQIRFVVVDTHDWLPGRRVLLATDAIASFDRATREARVRLTRTAVKASPPYEGDSRMPTPYFTRVRQHLGNWI